MSSPIPVVDMQSSTAAGDLLNALDSVGFATLTGHGIDATDSFRASAAFFQLDADVKMRSLYKGHEVNRGYIPLGSISHSVFMSHDRKEAFDIGKEGEARMQTPWPVSLSEQEFKQPLLEFWKEMNSLQLQILKLLGQALQLEDPDYFADRCDKEHCNLRLNHYPGTQQQDEKGEASMSSSQRSASSHEEDSKTDFGTLTLVAQDASGGLSVQSRSDREWFNIPAQSGALVLLVGEMLERWTNGRLVSTRHITGSADALDKQVPPPPMDDELPEKFSIAFYCNANKDVTLAPILSGEGTRKNFSSVNAYDYLLDRLSVTIDAADEDEDE